MAACKQRISMTRFVMTRFVIWRHCAACCITQHAAAAAMHTGFALLLLLQLLCCSPYDGLLLLPGHHLEQLQVQEGKATHVTSTLLSFTDSGFVSPLLLPHCLSCLPGTPSR